MPVPVHTATLKDLDSCRRLDGSVTTQTVWNMQQSADRNRVEVFLSEVRLPRPLEVEYPARIIDLIERQSRGDVILVADDDHVIGFVVMSMDRASNTGWVDHLIVTPERRRQGIGTALMRGAVAEGRQAKLRTIFLRAPAKNGPCVAFCRRLGLDFCGYNEHQYADHEVTLLFAYRI